LIWKLISSLYFTYSWGIKLRSNTSWSPPSIIQVVWGT
jgi:hypothetical protein